MTFNTTNPLKKHEDVINRLFYKEETSQQTHLESKNIFNYKGSKILLISLVKELKEKKK